MSVGSVLLGAGITGVLIPVVWFLMLESISYLAHKRAPDALQKINATLKRMGHAAIDKLSDIDDEELKKWATA